MRKFIDAGLESIFATLVFVITTILLLFAAFGPHHFTFEGNSPDTQFTSGTMFVVGVWIITTACLLESYRDIPERVRLWFEDGTSLMSDVCGASKIQEGLARKVKVRFYSPLGEPEWALGDGFRKMPVIRSGTRLIASELIKETKE